MMNMFRWSHTLNNGTLKGTHAMPQKDITSDGDSTFEMGRRTYVRTLPKAPIPPASLVHLSQTKKWYGNRDASQIVANRRNTQIGLGTLNASTAPMSFTTHKIVNTIDDALTRTRAGGSVAPAKKGANRNNGLPPTFAPARPAIINKAVKYPALFH